MSSSSSSSSTDSVEVFDPEFKFLVEVPSSAVSHLPPARLNITRLVFCRNYRPEEGSASCAMGSSCKFVHVDMDVSTLEHHPIHVKYAWRHEDLCTYPRLPAGETLQVLAPNNRPPVDELPSERVLVTRGSLNRADHDGPLAHCAHYMFNRMCNRGERCNFIHAVHVDPNVVGDFKRAPARPQKSKNSAEEDAAIKLQQQQQTILTARYTEHKQQHEEHPKQQPCAECDSCGHSDTEEVSDSSLVIRKPEVRYYRHNPYSLMKVTIWVE